MQHLEDRTVASDLAASNHVTSNTPTGHPDDKQLGNMQQAQRTCSKPKATQSTDNMHTARIDAHRTSTKATSSKLEGPDGKQQAHR